MTIWIDADACPTPVREIVARAAHKRCIASIFVANKELPLPQSEFVRFIQVESNPDAADLLIADSAQASDLVVTEDIPLAARLVEQHVTVLTPRGVKFTPENITEALAKRDFLSEFRDVGLIAGGQAPFDERNKRLFANHLNAELDRLQRQAPDSPSRDG